jgi:hypothetical protein
MNLVRPDDDGQNQRIVGACADRMTPTLVWSSRAPHRWSLEEVVVAGLDMDECTDAGDVGTGA